MVHKHSRNASRWAVGVLRDNQNCAKVHVFAEKSYANGGVGIIYRDILAVVRARLGYVLGSVWLGSLPWCSLYREHKNKTSTINKYKSWDSYVLSHLHLPNH